MKNTHKDRRDKKLHRFLKELDGHNFFGSDIDSYEKWRNDLYKKYGFTEDDWHKAVRLARSWTADENGLKKTKRIQRKKTLRDMYHDLDRSDMNDNPNGEAEIKAEDRWILDVYDEYFDKEDMSR